MSRFVIRGIGRCFTSGEEGVVEAAAVVVSDDVVEWVGRERDLGAVLAGAGGQAPEELDIGGALLTPGLIDAHTHPLYGGHRFGEIALRSAGASYAEIAAAGGGIASTVAATRATTAADLEMETRARLRAWLAGGTTTLEAKTGYDLTEAGELEAVRILSRLGSDASLPAVEVTWLAGHGVAPEWSGDPDGYIDTACKWADRAAAAGARHVDVFCDEGYFTVDQARRLLTAGAAAGMSPRIHADEIARTGGALLAADLGCSSADHLLLVDESDARALAAAGVVATLAPVTALAMGQRPPVQALLEAGVPIALGSDHNPGTCGTTSMSLVIALGVAELGLSVDQALRAATAGGARSLRLEDRGRIGAGLRADLAAWNADHEGAFAWAYGLEPSSVWRAGVRASS